MSGKTDLQSALSQLGLPSLTNPTKPLIKEFADKLTVLVQNNLSTQDATPLVEEITKQKKRTVTTAPLLELVNALESVAFRYVENVSKSSPETVSSGKSESTPTKEEEEQVTTQETPFQQDVPTISQEKQWAHEYANRLIERNDVTPINETLLKQAHQILFTEDASDELYSSFSEKAQEELKRVAPPSKEQISQAEEAQKKLVSQLQKLQDQDLSKELVEKLKKGFAEAKKTATGLSDYSLQIAEASQSIEKKLDLQEAAPVYEQAYKVIKELLPLIVKYEKETGDQDRYVTVKKTASESLSKEQKSLQDANALLRNATKFRDNLLAIFELLEAQGLAKSYLNLKDPNFDGTFSKTLEAIQTMKLSDAKDNLSTVQGFIQQAPQKILQVMQNKISMLKVELGNLSNQNDPLLSKKVDNTEETLRKYTRELSARITILKELDAARTNLKSVLDEIIKTIGSSKDFDDLKTSVAEHLKNLNQKSDLKALQQLVIQFSDELAYLKDNVTPPKSKVIEPRSSMEEPVKEEPKSEEEPVQQSPKQEAVQSKEKLPPQKKAENTWHFIEPLNKQIATLQSEVLQLTILADRLKNEEKEQAIVFINQLQNDLTRKLEQIKEFKEKFTPKK